MVLKNQVDDEAIRNNKMARICLSGAHFVYRSSKWHFQGNLEEANENDMESPLHTIRLNGELVATYDKVRRCWTLFKKQNDFESQDSCDFVEDKQSVTSSDVTEGTTHTDTAPNDQKSVTDCITENTGKGLSLKSGDGHKTEAQLPYVTTDANCNFPQPFLAGCNLLKSSPQISSKQTKKKFGTNDKENYHFTTNTACEPVGVVGIKQEKTANVFQDKLHEEEDYISFWRSGSLRSKLVNSNFSSEDERDWEGADHSSDECLVLVRDIYRQITRHMSKLKPEDALNDTRCKVVGELIYQQFVPALWSLIARGLKKPKLWQSKITPWTIVSSTDCCHGDLIRFVEAANCYSLADKEKFKFFVCKCLNYGRGTLETWFALYYRQLITVDTAVRKCYEESYVDEARSVLEEVKSEISRLSYLPFRLYYPRQLQERSSKFTCQTMVSYE